MSSVSDVASLSAVYGVYYNMYEQYKSSNPGATFESFCACNGIFIANACQIMDNVAEGNGGDGIDGNTISYDRSYFDSTGAIFETSSGSVIQITDSSSSSTATTSSTSNNGMTVSQYTNSTDIGNFFEDKFNVSSNAYDDVIFGRNSLTFNEYSFSGLGDGANTFNVALTDNANYKYTEIDTTTAKGQAQLKDAIYSYLEQHNGNIGDDFRNIFGWNDTYDKAVSYSKSGNVTTVTITQNGTTFVVSYDQSKNKITKFGSSST